MEETQRYIYISSK